MKSTKVLNPWCFLLLVLDNKAKRRKKKLFLLLVIIYIKKHPIIKYRMLLDCYVY